MKFNGFDLEDVYNQDRKTEPLVENPLKDPILEGDNSYLLPDVPFKDNYYDIFWSKKHLDNGAYHSHTAWLDRKNKNLDQGWQIPSLRILTHTLLYLYNNPSKHKPAITYLISQAMKENMYTSTAVVHKPTEGISIRHHDEISMWEAWKDPRVPALGMPLNQAIFVYIDALRRNVMKFEEIKFHPNSKEYEACSAVLTNNGIEILLSAPFVEVQSLGVMVVKK